MDLEEEINIEKKIKTMVANDKKIVSIVIAIIIFFIFISFVSKVSLKNNNIEVVENFNNLPAPVQVSTKGKEIRTLDGTEVEIEYVADYVVTGKVVDKYKYIEYDEDSMLVPFDVGLAWGVAGSDLASSKIKWESHPSRFLIASVEDGAWLKSVGGFEKLGTYFSNNHLIPNDNKIKNMLRLIKVGDHVKLTGYLINATWSDEKGTYYRKSSTTRDDTGDGACESMMVTDVKWLIEK